MRLDVALQRARAELRIGAVFDDVRLCRIGDGEVIASRFEALLKVLEQKLHDVFEVLAGQGLKEDDLVEPVEELGPEVRPELRLHQLVGRLVDLAVLVYSFEDIRRA